MNKSTNLSRNKTFKLNDNKLQTETADLIISKPFKAPSKKLNKSKSFNKINSTQYNTNYQVKDSFSQVSSDDGASRKFNKKEKNWMDKTFYVSKKQSIVINFFKENLFFYFQSYTGRK